MAIENQPYFYQQGGGRNEMWTRRNLGYQWGQDTGTLVVRVIQSIKINNVLSHNTVIKII